MSNLNLLIPNPDGSGRYCVFDPVAGKYVRGGINVSRLQAAKLIRDVRPQTWEELARAAGWLPPEEFVRRWQEQARSLGWVPPEELQAKLEEQAALTEAALAVHGPTDAEFAAEYLSSPSDPQPIQEPVTRNEPTHPNSIGPDEL